jgi:RNA polymerase sigma-70 factor (ECF subfamily)
MLFVCCHPDLPVESRIAMALRILCGFSPAEIARGLLTTEGNVQKRIVRAKEILRRHDALPEPLSPETIVPRLSAVQIVLYLMFNEGYNSASADVPIRFDVCHEAMRLTRLLAEHPLCATPETHALLALMCLHAARFTGRFNDRGELLLLEDQDREQWDAGLMQAGLVWLNRSSIGERISRYHLEAGISAEHCLAADFCATNWERIVSLYDLLVAVAPSPLHHLNRAVAIAEWKGPSQGLDELNRLTAAAVMENYYLWHAVRAELLRRMKRWKEAEALFAQALSLTKSTVERQLLARRWEECHHARSRIEKVKRDDLGDDKGSENGRFVTRKTYEVPNGEDSRRGHGQLDSESGGEDGEIARKLGEPCTGIGPVEAQGDCLIPQDRTRADARLCQPDRASSRCE